MKLPVQLEGVERGGSRSKPRVSSERVDAAVLPQDMMCEDTCHETYGEDPSAKQTCLDWCRRS